MPPPAVGVATALLDTGELAPPPPQPTNHTPAGAGAVAGGGDSPVFVRAIMHRHVSTRGFVATVLVDASPEQIAALLNGAVSSHDVRHIWLGKDDDLSSSSSSSSQSPPECRLANYQNSYHSPNHGSPKSSSPTHASSSHSSLFSTHPQPAITATHPSFRPTHGPPNPLRNNFTYRRNAFRPQRFVPDALAVSNAHDQDGARPPPAAQQNQRGVTLAEPHAHGHLRSSSLKQPHSRIQNVSFMHGGESCLQDTHLPGATHKKLTASEPSSKTESTSLQKPQFSPSHTHASRVACVQYAHSNEPGSSERLSPLSDNADARATTSTELSPCHKGSESMPSPLLSSSLLSCTSDIAGTISGLNQVSLPGTGGAESQAASSPDAKTRTSDCPDLADVATEYDRCTSTASSSSPRSQPSCTIAPVEQRQVNHDDHCHSSRPRDDIIHRSDDQKCHGARKQRRGVSLDARHMHSSSYRREASQSSEISIFGRGRFDDLFADQSPSVPEDCIAFFIELSEKLMKIACASGALSPSDRSCPSATKPLQGEGSTAASVEASSMTVAMGLSSSKPEGSAVKHSSEASLCPVTTDPNDGTNGSIIARGHCGFETAHDAIDILCDGFAIRKSGKGLYRTARARGGACDRHCGPSRFYFEVHVVEDCDGDGMTIGVTTSELPLNKLIGSDNHSVGLHSSGQLVMSGGTFKPYAPRGFSKGSRVGCLVSFGNTDPVMMRNPPVTTLGSRAVSMDAEFVASKGLMKDPLVSDMDAGVSSDEVEVEYFVDGVSCGAVKVSLLSSLIGNGRKLYPAVSLYRTGSKAILRCCEADWDGVEDSERLDFVETFCCPCL